MSSKNMKNLEMLALVILAVVIVGGVAMYLMNMNKKNTPSTMVVGESAIKVPFWFLNRNMGSCLINPQTREQHSITNVTPNSLKFDGYLTPYTIWVDESTYQITFKGANGMYFEIFDTTTPTPLSVQTAMIMSSENLSTPNRRNHGTFFVC